MPNGSPRSPRLRVPRLARCFRLTGCFATPAQVSVLQSWRGLGGLCGTSFAARDCTPVNRVPIPNARAIVCHKLRPPALNNLLIRCERPARIFVMKAMVFECVVSLMFPAPARVHAGSPSEQHRTAPRWPLPTSMQASKVPPLPGRVLMPAAHHLFSAQDPAAPRCTRRLTSAGRPPAVPPLVRVRPRTHARSSPPLLRAGPGGAVVHVATDERREAAGGAAPCPRAAACSCPQLTASSPRRTRRPQ